MGKLFAIEPTFGVSFGLPGGYPQAGGGYPLNPVGNNPIVNPYNGGGIPLGPISINPLVSFQKSKDKTKTKLWRPLVNLHITPNPYLFKGIKGIIKAHKAKGLFGHGWGHPEYLYGGGYGGGYGYPIGGYPSAVPVPYPVPIHGGGGGLGLGSGIGQPPIHHNHDHWHHYPTAHTSPFIAKPSYGYSSSSSSPYYAGSYGSGYSSSKPYSYGSGGGFSSFGGSGLGYGHAKGSSSYGPSVEYSPFYKLDKKGPLDLIMGAFAGSSGIKTPTGGGFGEGGLGNFFKQNAAPGIKKPGKVNEASGLTPEQESLLEALLKEEAEEEKRSQTKLRSGLQTSSDTNDNTKRPVGNVEFSDSNRNTNNGFTLSSPSSNSKTKFPDDSTNNNYNANFAGSSSSGGTNFSNDDRYRTGVPISFPDSRLPANAASMTTGDGSSDPYSQSPGSPSMVFPQEPRSIFSDSLSSTSNSNDQTSGTYHSFNNYNGDNNNDNTFHQQGSTVTFPLDSTSSTSSHLRMTREIRTQPPPPTATVDGRVLQGDDQVRRKKPTSHLLVCYLQKTLL